MAEAISKAVRTPITFNEREILLTASIGIVLRDPSQRADEAIKDAELALATAKRSRGDRFEVFKSAMRATRTIA